MNWRMPAPCETCPFNSDGPGLFLRMTLRRWPAILRGLRSDQHFICHKTSDETGNGTNLICAGALEWQHKRGLSSNLERIMERIDDLVDRGLVKKGRK